MGENTTTKTNNAPSTTKDGSASEFVDNEGQGKLYSPDFAIKLKKQETKEEQQRSEGAVDMGVAADIRRNFGAVKERLLEKLASAAVPADALDNARHFLETVVRDVTMAAQGLTKDALNRIKTHLVEILPSLSPAITKKMVDEAEKEVNEDQTGSERKEAGTHNQPSHGSKAPYMSPASSLFASPRFSRL